MFRLSRIDYRDCGRVCVKNQLGPRLYHTEIIEEWVWVGWCTNPEHHAAQHVPADGEDAICFQCQKILKKAIEGGGAVVAAAPPGGGAVVAASPPGDGAVVGVCQEEMTPGGDTNPEHAEAPVHSNLPTLPQYDSLEEAFNGLMVMLERDGSTRVHDVI